MKKAIFLDRDGTLNEDLGYTYKAESLELLPGVLNGLKKLKDFELFIVTNQSGIGRNYYTEKDMHNYNNQMLEEFDKHKIKIEKIYFCPHSPEDSCDCRKPNIKYVKEAEKEFGIDLKKSYVIGDHPADMGLAKNSGCKGIYLLTGHGVKHLDEARGIGLVYVAANFEQAARYILFNKYDKIIEKGIIGNLAKQLKESEKKIVTINGTFDILHIGHEKILKEAKEQGDVLIVGVNSDLSVKENKGEKRPINNEKSRAKMLANFDFVDYVVVFNEKTPIEVLDEIKPNIHVNGSEYGEECIEAETVKKNGGKIHVVKLVEGHSTTKIIECAKK